MITVDEALEAVLTRSCPLSAKRVPLINALGCTLAEDVSADIDLPPFDKALVDGYAVRSADFAEPDRLFRIGEEITAGQYPTRPLAIREAAAIMTGAPLPLGADAVVMIERTERAGESVVVHEPVVRAGMNRLTRGRELRAGDVVSKRGERLTAARLGLLASVGRTEVHVVPRAQIAIVPTGDELVEPDRVPGPGQIRNSNALVLEALALGSDAFPRCSSIAPDEPEALLEALGRGLSSDVLVITGGVSAGNRDFVPQTLERLGVTRVFHKVRLKPGKPLWFGVGPTRGDGRSGALVFGLPGNPVSVVVGFLLFVRPALHALAGRPVPRLDRRFPIARPFSHSGDRPTYHPALLVEGPSGVAIDPLEWAGSADLRTVAAADGFAGFPAGDHDYRAGDVVDFLDLS